MSHRRLLAFSLWLVAVLYCWCGAFYKFSFLRAEDDSPLSFWIRVGAVLYCILLLLGLWLFRADRRVHLRILRAAHAPVRSFPAPVEKLTHTATFALTAVSAWILSAISVSIMACPAGLGWIPSAHSSSGYRWEERNAERTSIIGHP